MKRFLMCAVLAATLTATSAPGDVLTGGGLRAGLTFGKLEAENAPPLNTGYGVNIGIMVGCGLSKHFGLVAELDMTDMGLGYYKNTAGKEVSIRNGAITVPLALRLRIADAFPLYLAAGGQLEFPFFSKAAIDTMGYAIAGRSFADIGITAGIGYQFDEAFHIR